MKTVKQNAADRERNAGYLLEYRGAKIAACVKHVSKSGMQRVIDFYAITYNKERKALAILSISHLIASVLDWRYTNYDSRGVIVNGCGMDMIFHTLSSLNYAMAQRIEGKPLSVLTGKGGKLEGQRIYDNYFFDANAYVHL
jgi:hypothetical protein